MPGGDKGPERVRFKGLDLNLLVAFDALIELRNVSRAAERLNMSQPAMTAALNRLREYFADDLFIQNGRRMAPTVLASTLQPQVQKVLADLQNLVATSGGFDPSSSERTFRLATSDFVAAVVVAPLVETLARIAPNIRLDMSPPNEMSKALLERGDLDLFITPEEFLSPLHPAKLLFEEDHVLVGWAGNQAFLEPIDEDQFFAMRHVTTWLGAPNGGSFAERRFEATGRTRRIILQASNFTTVPFMLIGTDHVAVMHRRLAERMAVYLPLRISALPFAFPAMREMVQYHRVREDEPGLTWLIDMLVRAANP